jgi:sporulation protein YlmC with PRC-barrel domain
VEPKARRTLTREKILGMQVINHEGYKVGTVKDVSLVVGSPDQALIIDDGNGKETEVLWSEISAAGDVILLRQKEEKSINTKSSPEICPSCGTKIESGAGFCGNCGKKI